jgi:hypothetical protein
MGFDISYTNPLGAFKNGVGTARPQDFPDKTENLGTSRPHPGFGFFLNPLHTNPGILVSMN